MNTTGQAWQKFQPPFDPRRMDGATVTEDEFGRLVETADCGTRCPGYGQCCPPDELRGNVSTVAQANAVLLERNDATLAEIEDALLFLAHQGTKEAVEIIWISSSEKPGATKFSRRL